MNQSDYKMMYTIVAAIVLSITMTLCYNLYTNAKNRELYEQCLKVSADVSATTSSRRISCYNY